ncbi:MAG: HAMP domain-containing sensor histidine kinase [Acidobacteriota bacterium]
MAPSSPKPASPQITDVERIDLRRPHRARRVLWIGSVAVLVPLALLLWLQYRWLQDLEKTSTVARQASLENILIVIAKGVKFEYLNAAERVLNLPPTILEPRYAAKVGSYLAKRDTPLVRRTFVVNFSSTNREDIQFFDRESGQLFVPEWSSEVAAVQIAIAPWRVLRKKGDPIDDTPFVVEERDPNHRMILKPLTGEDSRLVGMVGMTLDEEYFRSTVLPAAIDSALPEFDDPEALKVSVRDGAGDWILGEAVPSTSEVEDDTPAIWRSLAFVFSDWRVVLHGPSSAPAAWARTNFAVNLSLTMVLSVLVIGGLGLLLRTTSREMRLSEMKNDFVSNVSHELRTPLASIRVFGELMRLGKIRDHDKVRQYGDYIEAESRRLTQLINNILDFSCIESGRKAYAFESVDLVEIVDEMLDTWRIRLEHQGFTLDIQQPATLPAVRADRDAIGQALFNLLDNAVKYSGESKRIEVHLRRDSDEASIAVVDHGIGISRTEQRHIFDRFHRVGSGLAHDVKGSGLGLSLVEHIAAAHGGRVTVSSSVGQGSTFTLHLPLLSASPNSTPEVETAALQPEAAGASS